MKTAAGPNAALAAFSLLIAGAALASALRAQPASLLLRAAHRLESEERLDEALAIHDALVARAPERAKPRVDRARVRMALLEFDAARVDVDRAVELNPFWAPAREARAVIREAQGDAAGAEEDLSAAIESSRRPTPTRALSARAALRASRGRLALALSDLERAIAAGAYEDAGSAKTTRAAERALLAQPHDERRLAARRLADAHAKRGAALLDRLGPTPGAALAAFERAFALEALPTHAYGAARSALALGDPGLALDHLERGFIVGLRDWRRLRADARLAALRSDPRFGDLLRRMGAHGD